MPSVSERLIPDELAIRISDVSIRYKASYESNPTLRNAFLKWGRRGGGKKRKVKVIEAVKHVSMDVPHGSVLGILGANGAGKSTIMRAMAGILPPTEGRIIVNGRVSTLLALGVGFNPMLSGRENVILGGLAAGLTVEEVEAKFDQIADFAELGDFIDMPMRTYSAGMYGRLGFSVSVNMEPDILLIDEALSTGDAAFREKSVAKMRELVQEARTIVIVSHALGLMQELCNSAAWLHKGELLQTGTPQDVVEAYMRFLKVGETPTTLEDL